MTPFVATNCWSPRWTMPSGWLSSGPLPDSHPGAEQEARPAVQAPGDRPRPDAPEGSEALQIHVDSEPRLGSGIREHREEEIQRPSFGTDGEDLAVQDPGDIGEILQERRDRLGFQDTTGEQGNLAAIPDHHGQDRGTGRDQVHELVVGSAKPGAKNQPGQAHAGADFQGQSHRNGPEGSPQGPQGGGTVLQSQNRQDLFAPAPEPGLADCLSGRQQTEQPGQNQSPGVDGAGFHDCAHLCGRGGG